MSSFEAAAQIFESSFSKEDYFESLSAEFTKNTLVESIKRADTPLIFLLGEPGVGKTYMLHLIKEELRDSHRIIMVQEPFLTPESFLQFIVGADSSSASLAELKERATQMYSDVAHLIIIDEAQLLSESVLEYIRILSDTKVFHFMLSMHKEDGELILKKPHFASRDHRSVTLGILESSEVKNYMESQLLRHGMGDFAAMFREKELAMIATYTSGNFRMLKQMFKTIFSLMHYAKLHGHKDYCLPNRCIVMMAAIDLGCLDA
ncbi:MAG: ATP-binding protein [Campylobacterota bacterium]|nr:ATP-binding protein [Campylobacterota bacterium]